VGTRDQVPLPAAALGEGHQVLGLAGLQDQEVEAEVDGPVAGGPEEEGEPDAVRLDGEDQPHEDLQGRRPGRPARHFLEQLHEVPRGPHLRLAVQRQVRLPDQHRARQLHHRLLQEKAKHHHCPDVPRKREGLPRVQDQEVRPLHGQEVALRRGFDSARWFKVAVPEIPGFQQVSTDVPDEDLPPGLDLQGDAEEEEACLENEEAADDEHAPAAAQEKTASSKKETQKEIQKKKIKEEVQKEEEKTQKEEKRKKEFQTKKL